MKTKVIIIIILIAAALIGGRGCLFYDYGVDRNKVELDYPAYYFHGRSNDIIFYPVLYSEQKELGSSRNYTKFTVYTNNIQKGLVGSDKGSWVSSLNFSLGSKESEIKILADTVKIVHKDGNGSLIPEIKESNNINECISKGWHECTYSKMYGQKTLPKVIHQYISFEVVVNGRKIKIEKTYPIELKYHYSRWDVMMGV
jgi:hypothetical protein